MTPNLHQIEVIGRYGQAHDPLLTTRLKSRSLRSSPFLPILRVFCNLTLWNFYICLAFYYPAPRLYCFCGFCMFRRYSRIQHLFGALLSCPSAADPISLDMLVWVASLTHRSGSVDQAVSQPLLTIFPLGDLDETCTGFDSWVHLVTP